ncbi:M35 family metallo-endopeptidase [Chitinimonas arctica]|uniref:M35 family metallo-endopeptidase n=1 Tax=Chitinimonas arctica TaxID=2594795 RepID=UPI0015D0D247|nr:M35 family metallo-endopeptidase [Chitinimonas arctica]
MVQASDLRVDVAAVRSSALANQDVEVNLRYTNAGKQTLHVLKWFVPGKELQEAMFDVRRDGKPVEYLGPQVKRRAPIAEDMIAVLPGQTVSAKVKLSSVYDMSQSGNYSIRYKADSARVLKRSPLLGRAELAKAGAESVESVESEELASNDIALWVEGRSSPLLRQAEEGRKLSALMDRVTASSVTYASNCSVTRRTQISSGVSAASSYANNSTSYLNGTPSGTTRYTTWFGRFSSANWNTAKAQFTKIKDALDNKPLVFDCSCTDSGVYAYVYPNQPYKIYLCGAYWAAANTGTDSRGGTIVHELSHFNVVAGTDDHVYGQSGAKALARSNPTRALNNADNHEYFAENTPYQP